MLAAALTKAYLYSYLDKETAMLRDGQFIKEEPPKIGSHYVPQPQSELTKEERFAQNLLLGIEEKRQSFLSKVLGVMMRV